MNTEIVCLCENGSRFENSNLGLRRMTSASALTLADSLTLHRSPDLSEPHVATSAMRGFQTLYDFM